MGDVLPFDLGGGGYILFQYGYFVAGRGNSCSDVPYEHQAARGHEPRFYRCPISLQLSLTNGIQYKHFKHSNGLSTTIQ